MSAAVAITNVEGDLLEEFYVISCDGVSAGGFDAFGYLTWVFDNFTYARLDEDTKRFHTEDEAVAFAKRILHEDSHLALKSPNGKLMFTLADYKMADEWLAKTFPDISRRANAMNFHNVF